MQTSRIHLAPFSRYWEAYQREKEHFVEAIANGTKVCISGKMVLAVAKVFDACQRSAKSGMPEELRWSKGEIPEEYSM